jgi:formylglycine-generating enzyme required for sulfatase activity
MRTFAQVSFLGWAMMFTGLAGEPASPAPSLAGMVLVPAGSLAPFLREERGLDRVPVPAFWLDRLPVTTGEYLGFVRENSPWRRSQVRRLFADQGYLAGWSDDLTPSAAGNGDLRQPVTQVSWFAARAYASWKGLRLPSTLEWERAASIGLTNEIAANDPGFQAALGQWYGGFRIGPLPAVGSDRPNLLGIHDLHGLIWEWTSDFNSLFVNGDARSDSGVDRSLFCAGGSLTARDRNDYAAFMRYGFRSSLKAAYTVHNLGFRCAKNP